jgi:hypothetical protein
LFSHTLPVMYRPCFPGFDLNMIRCHPFAKWKSYLLLNVVVVMPPIPVLHLLFIAQVVLTVSVGALLWLVASKVDDEVLFRTVIEPLVNILDNMASILRQYGSKGTTIE